MVITGQRMGEFEEVLAVTDDPLVVTGVIGYVRTVNPLQVPQLVQVGLASTNQDVRSAAAAFV